MDSLLDAVLGVDADNAKLIRELEAWAGEVLVCREDAFGLNDNSGGLQRTLDPYVGVLVARGRLENVVARADLVLVASIDALFVSFTEEVRSDWIRVTGMEDLARDDWWRRLPTRGPVRDELDALVSKGVFESLGDARRDGD